MRPDQCPSTPPPRARLSGAKAAWSRIFPLLAAAGLLIVPGWLRAQAPVAKEYQVKAAFLFNFAQFVEWPAASFADADAPLVLGILGDDPFGPALDDIIKGEIIHGHRLVTRRSRRLEDLKDCQLLFVSKSERGRLAEVLAQTGGRSVLTVGESEGFAREGGVINFYLEGSKIRFEINPVAAQRGGLRMSSQLLSLGKLVEPDPATRH